MDDKIIALADYRLQKAKEDMETARVNMKHSKFSQSINRSYYAIFHAVRALLALRQLNNAEKFISMIEVYIQHLT